MLFRSGGINLSKLVGTFDHTVDSKGRINIPSRFREVLGEEFVITRSTNQSLMLFSQQGWDDFIDRFSDGPLSEFEDIQYYFMGYAHSDSTDKQGRIVVPARLREYANIDKEVTIVGLGSKIEVWSTALWNDKMNALTPADIARRMKEARL